MEVSPNHSVLFDSDEGVQLSADNVKRVFGIDLIREMILDYVCHDGKDVAIGNVRSCRLVNKTWHRSTHAILRRAQEPIFLFYLLANKSKLVGRKKFSVKNEQFGEFLLSMSLPGGNTGLQQIPPPHIIHAFDDFFCPKNCQSFFNYLVTCGSSLIQLELDKYVFFPVENHVISLKEKVLLPKLRKLDVLVYTDEHAKSVNSVQLDRFDFIQFVLETSEQLLRKLTLAINDMSYEDGLIHRILQNVRKTITFCHFIESDQRNESRRHTSLQLPLLEKLERLEIAPCLQLKGSLSSLQRLMPVLNHLTLNQTNSTFLRWTEQSCFSSVKSLDVSLMGSNYFNVPDLTYFHGSMLANVELRTMETLTFAFPNLQELDINFYGTELSVLELIMREMRTLCRLRIFVEDREELANPDAWNALLLGVPVASLAELRDSPVLLEELQAVNGCSIRNLTELHTLGLASRFVCNEREYPIISDLVFHYAFFKLPKLTKLILKGCFYDAANKIEGNLEKEGLDIKLQLNLNSDDEDSGDDNDDDDTEDSDDDDIEDSDDDDTEDSDD